MNATELASDLRKYQAGLAISWRPFAPVVFETDGNLRHDWIAYHCDNWGSEAAVTEDDRYCAWTICDNILKGANTGCFDNLTYRRKIRGNLRVEWRLLTRLGTENLNCYIAGENRKAGYLFHIGANGESRQILLTKGFDQIVMDLTWLPHSLEMNVWHDLVMEKENETLRLFIDGRQIICCQDPDMLDGRGHQTFGFETCNGNSYEIAGVKIFYQPLPQAISPVTVGDRFLEENYFEEAISQYEEIIESYPETGLAQRAQLKAARCKKALGDLDGAKKLLEGFVDAYPDSELVPYCMCDIARINIESYGPESIADVIDTLATKIPGHPLLRSLLFDISLYYQRHFRRVDPVQSKAFVESVSTRFGIPLTDNSYLRFLAHKYSEKKQFDQVLQDFPYLEIECADALINMGKPEKVLERYPAMRTKCAKALLQLGHPERVLQDYPELKEECAEALLRMDRPEDVLRLYPDLREKCALALLSLRRYEELLDKYRDRHWICGMALMKMGRLDDIAGYFPDDKGLKAFVLFQKRQYRETLEQHFGNYTTRTLLALCKPEEVVERYSNSERQDFVADALLALGREEEIPDRFPQCRGQCAAFFIRHGQFETVLDDYQDQPEMVIKALICKDMANEAIERYPSLRSDISLALNRLGHYDYLLANCPEQSGAIAEALIALGRAHEVMERFPAKQDECANALLSMGEFARVIQSYSILSDKGIRALIMMGRYDEAIERYPDSHHFMPEALIALGRIDELLDTQFAGRPHRIHALIIQGKQDTIFSRYRDLAGSCIMAHLSIGENETAVSRYERNPDVWRELLYCKYYEAVKTAISGDLAGAQEQLSSLTGNQIHFDNHYFLFPRFILPAFLRLLTGDIEGARQLLEDNSKKFPYQFAQRLRHYLEFLTGRIGNEEFGNQPCRRYIEPDTLLCSGLRAEFAGDETATGFYREYAALSAWKRELNPLLDIFVDWRIRAAEE